MSKIIATSYSSFDKNAQWKQRILFYDVTDSPFLLNIKIHRDASMIEIMNKIQRLLISNHNIVKLCFGEDIGNNIIKFLPFTQMRKELNNFYTYTEKFHLDSQRIFKTRTIINNNKLLYEIIRDHRHHSRELTLRLRARPCY